MTYIYNKNLLLTKTTNNLLLNYLINFSLLEKAFYSNYQENFLNLYMKQNNN